MLTIGLSLNGGIKLLERALAVRMRSINRKLQEVVYSLSPAAVEATAVADVQAPKLKIAKTTLPDKSLDFNQTFQHIRYELDLLYMRQNPGFTNTIVPVQHVDTTAKQEQRISSVMQQIGNTLVPASRPAQASKQFENHKALHVAKTAQPDVRLDFNQTFLHIRYGLDGFYGGQHLN